MKKVLLSLAVCLTMLSQAASIRWDCFASEPFDYDGANGLRIEYRGYEDPMGSASAMPCVFVGNSRSGNIVTISGTTLFANLAFQGFWVQMPAGDLIDHSTMMSYTDYFAATEPYGESRLAETPIKTTGNSTIYLAVVQDTVDMFPSDPIDYYYGWVELNVDARGDVSLGRSAFALDGSAMIVGGGAAGGAIPEPSGAVLVLVGAGLLGLRRRKRTT